MQFIYTLLINVDTMDKKLLEALGNLSIALESISDALDNRKGEAESSVGSALQSGDMGKQVLEINKGIKMIKDDTSKILDNQQTLIKLQKEKNSEKEGGIFGKTGEKNKKKIQDGVSTVLLIAGAVLAIGLAFKIIGQVDFMSVIALSFSLPLVAYAFEKIAGLDLTYKSMVSAFGTTVTMSLAIAAASYILGLVKPIGPAQLFTTIAIAVAFSLIALSIGKLVKAFKGINPVDALKASFLMPILLIGISAAIVGSSYLLRLVAPIGLAQAFSVIVIAAAFGVISYGIGNMIKGFKDVDPIEAAAFALMAPVVLIGISAAIVGSSWVLQLTASIGFSQAFSAIVIAGVFVIISYAIKPLMKGVKNANVDDMVKGGVILVILSAAISAASYPISMMAPVTFGQIFSLTLMSIGLAVSALALGVAIWGINKLGSIKDYIMGGLSIVVIASVISLSSIILGMGSYDKYPSLDWSLGVGASIIGFGLAAIGLGFMVMSGIGAVALAAGGVAILVVAVVIVATSYILGLGSYGKYPDLDWVLGVGTSLLAFGVAAMALAFSLPLIIPGGASILAVAGTILLTSYILESGSYGKYPDLDWVLGVGTSLLAFGVAAMALAFSLPLIIPGGASILAVAGTIVLVSHILGSGSYGKYPTSDWVIGVGSSFIPFAASAISLGFALPLILLGSLSIMSIVKMIQSIDGIFQSGSFDKFPTTSWVDGVCSSINKFSKLNDEISGGGVGGFFNSLGNSVLGAIGLGKDSISPLLGISSLVLSVDRILSQGDYTKFPDNKWVDSVIHSLGKFSLMNFVSSVGNFFGWLGGGSEKAALGIVSIDKILSQGNFSKYPSRSWVEGIAFALEKYNKLMFLVGSTFNSGNKNMKSLSSMVGSLVMLATAFDRLSESFNKFNSSISAMDAEKLSSLRSFSSSVVLLSLMDADQFEEMMNKLEDKSSVFSELVNDFETKKAEASTGGSGSGFSMASGGNGSGAEFKELSGKVDQMTAILANISSVVGAGGTLQTYLNSIKENQLDDSYRFS